MKHLRKSILTLLALTLFGGAGAWAQGPTVKEITPEMIATGWLEVYDEVTANDFPGFVAIDSAVAAAWTGAPQSGFVALFYGFESDGRIKAIGFRDGSYDGAGAANWDRDGLYHQRITNGVPIYYTTGDGTIELTKSGANQWSLGQTPDYDLELQVEYYEAHALKEIPAGWTVMVNGVAQAQPYQGDSLMITETDSVTLVPAGNPRRVKSVTLADEGPAVVEPITVTINQSDWAWGSSFTKDGVTVSALMIDPMDGNLTEGGTFSTTLGNFTSIVVTSGFCNASGTGWSGNHSSMTWSGTPASSVSFSGDIMGMGQTQTTIVCTIVPTN